MKQRLFLILFGFIFLFPACQYDNNHVKKLEKREKVYEKLVSLYKKKVSTYKKLVLLYEEKVSKNKKEIKNNPKYRDIYSILEKEIHEQE